MYNDLIENYKDLLYTIFNVDTDDTNIKSLICVYDTFEDEKLIAIFNNSKSCAKFFNTTTKCIDSTICKKILRMDRYKLERLKLEEEYDRRVYM